MKLIHVNYQVGGIYLFYELDGSTSQSASGTRAIGWRPLGYAISNVQDIPEGLDLIDPNLLRSASNFNSLVKNSTLEIKFRAFRGHCLQLRIR
jgi:hypothetical protein